MSRLVKVIPYITVPNGKAAINSYIDLFNATLVDHMPFTEEVGAGFGFPEDFDYESSTMHAVIEIQGGSVFLSDGNAAGKGNVEIVLDFELREQVEEVWGKVKKAGYEVVMELEEQFWGAPYGRYVDGYGVGWQLNYTIPK